MLILLQPPLSFQPQNAIPSVQNIDRQAQAARNAMPKSEGQDLVTRYNLGSKIAAEHGDNGGSEASPIRGWSQNKDERQRLLRNRRDEMILAARRKIMQKDKDVV